MALGGDRQQPSNSGGPAHGKQHAPSFNRLRVGRPSTGDGRLLQLAMGISFNRRWAGSPSTGDGPGGVVLQGDGGSWAVPSGASSKQ
jgi:hypothetical protein